MIVWQTVSVIGYAPVTLSQDEALLRRFYSLSPTLNRDFLKLELLEQTQHVC